MSAKKGTRPPNAGKGRRKGTPNKATADVRTAFAALLEGAVPKLQGWLDRVGKDDPARALNIVKDLAEYHIPKLSRAEVTGDGGKPIEVRIVQYGDDPPAA